MILLIGAMKCHQASKWSPRLAAACKVEKYQKKLNGGKIINLNS